VGSRGSDGLVRADGAHRHSLNAHDFNVGESDEAQDGAEIRLLKIELLRRTVGVNASAGEHQNEALAPKVNPPVHSPNR